MNLQTPPVRNRTSILIGLCFMLFAMTAVTAQAQIQVTASDPSSSAQGTINLNVKVAGKGFKNGAKAKWFVTGHD